MIDDDLWEDGGRCIGTTKWESRGGKIGDNFAPKETTIFEMLK